MKKLLFILSLLSVLVSCTRDEVENVSLGLRDYYNIPRFKKLYLTSPYQGTHTWNVQCPDGTEIVSHDKEFCFIKDKQGVYNFTYTLDDGIEVLRHHFQVNVYLETPRFQDRVTQVFDYCPAPGQFVNEMPKYAPGDTQKDMNTKVLSSLRSDVLVSLGACGGYVVMGFDHSIYNKDGNDFYIKGNSFFSDMLDESDRRGGSSESGIVYVSIDSNRNGLPDDEWYELKGSAFFKTDRTYQITYEYPTPHKPVVGDGCITDSLNCPWFDNRGNKGHVYKNSFHNQDYYPKWIKNKLVFNCSKLPFNAEDTSGEGTYWIQWCFGWGYVDNYPNAFVDKNSFDISNAVDSKGNYIPLSCIDFVKVQTGQNAYLGWLGETSTELSSFTDLNLKQLK